MPKTNCFNGVNFKYLNSMAQNNIFHKVLSANSVFYTLQQGGGRTRNRFVGFDPFFVGLSVKSSEFVGLSVKRKHCGFW